MKDNKPNIAMRDYSVGSPNIYKSRRDLMSFGANNNFPKDALDLALSSPLQRSILDSKVSYIIGAGPAKDIQYIQNPNLHDTWFSLFQKCVTDFVYLGAFCLEVIVSESGNKYFYYHHPVHQVRLGQYNERGVIDKAYLCNDWLKSNQSNIATLKMWGSETPKKGEHYLMYYKQHVPGEEYYAIPSYWSAANYIAADASLSQYYNNYINNNFSSNMVIRFPNEPDEEKKQELYENLMASFGGASNAGNILLLFGENDVLPEISSLESVNADLYNSVVDVVKLAIVSANRLTSPILAGISTSSGFSSKSDEIIAATVQYRLTVINPLRQWLLGIFNDLMAMNGLSRNFTLQDYNLYDEFNGVSEENTDKINEAIGANDTEEQKENE